MLITITVGCHGVSHLVGAYVKVNHTIKYSGTEEIMWLKGNANKLYFFDR